MVEYFICKNSFPSFFSSLPLLPFKQNFQTLFKPISSIGQISGFSSAVHVESKKVDDVIDGEIMNDVIDEFEVEEMKIEEEEILENSEREIEGDENDQSSDFKGIGTNLKIQICRLPKNYNCEIYC